VFRGPHRTCVELRAGCREILGRRSSGASPDTIVDPKDGEIATGDVKGWEIVGRRGASDVKVLEFISYWSMKECVKLTFGPVP
jgi:hypothetical protein